MEDRTFECTHPCDLRNHRLGNHPHATDEIFAGEDTAIAGCNLPMTLPFQILRFDNLCIKLNVGPHIAFIGDESHIALCLFPTRITLRPGPFLQQFWREGKAVIIAFAVGRCAGIVVPSPCTANIGSAVEYAHTQIQFSQIMDEG